LGVHETTVRFTDEVWTLVRQASRREHISAAQYVRDATLTRLTTEQNTGSLRVEVDNALAALAARLGHLEQVLRRHGLR
jgi:predicted DNA-binding ribbon-helix-helix protein